MTNNMAEYEALVRALRKARELAVETVLVYTDSELVAKQVLGSYRVKNDRLRSYLHEAQQLIEEFGQLRDTAYSAREERGSQTSSPKVQLQGSRGRRVVAGRNSLRKVGRQRAGWSLTGTGETLRKVQQKRYRFATQRSKGEKAG